MTEQPPQQIHMPSLKGVIITADKSNSTAKIKVSSQGQVITITVTNPRLLRDRMELMELSESDIEEQFVDECTMLSIFRTRLEFWGHDGLISSIGGSSVEVSCT
ncbi:MAG: hypothetical protein ABIF19_07765 [Planctomycetota bacterium]